MEVWFYHLQRQPLERVLPVLVGKALERGWTVVVQTIDAARVAALDDLLWTYSEDSFLPHASASDPRAARQPVVLTDATDDPNAAAVRIFVDGADAEPSLAGAAYERVMLLFDGRDEDALAAARGQWSRLKAGGHALSYWQQEESGRWERRMQSPAA